MRKSDTKCFPHERLDAYWVTQEAVARTVRLMGTVPRGFADLRDQARRSALSTARNIAEGASRSSPADKRARFTIARGEVAELHATIASAVACNVVDGQDAQQLLALTNRIAAMLCGLIRRERARQSSHMSRNAASRTATRARPR
jgi:four helix bundle protein